MAIRNVLCIAPAFAPFRDGSAYSMMDFVQKIAVELRANGIRTSLLGTIGSDSADFDEVVTVSGFTQPNLLDGEGRGLSAGKGYALDDMVLLATKALKSGRVDAVFNFSNDPQPFAMEMPGFVNVVSFHKGVSPRADEAIARRSSSRGLAFLSSFQACQYGMGAATVCGCPISVPGPAPGVDARRNGRFLFAGRICRDKGVETALELARKHALPIDFAGQAQDAGLVKKIGSLYLGCLTRGDLYAAMRRSSALIQVQDRGFQEAFGMVTAEALACGLPVVALDRGANAEVVGPDDGFIVPDLSDERSTLFAFASAAHLAADFDAGKRERIHARAKERFSVSGVVRRLFAEASAPTCYRNASGVVAPVAAAARW